MGAAEVAAVLAPLIVPFMKRAGAEARGQIASRVGGEAATSVASLWERLRGRVAGDIDATPDAAVESRLTELLEQDPALLEEARTTVSIVVRGDHNSIQQGRTNINISGGNDIQIGRLSD